jgi:hypothetical protein
VGSIGFGRIEEKGSEKFSKAVRANHGAIWGYLRGALTWKKEIYTRPPKDPDGVCSSSAISFLEHLIFSFKQPS